MRLLDLYSGAGGAAMGYHRGGYDEIVGVDLSRQKHFPFQFVQADALAVLDSWDLAAFDLIHASPPCQDHSVTRHLHEKRHGTAWLLEATRERLERSGVPWIIENVPGSPMRADYRLCGCMFDLPRLRRERWFETSWHGFDLRPPCYHIDRAVTVCGHGAQGSYEYDENGNAPDQETRRRAMGIDWMNRGELAQAIPPAFTEYLASQVPALTSWLAALFEEVALPLRQVAGVLMLDQQIQVMPGLPQIPKRALNPPAGKIFQHAALREAHAPRENHLDGLRLHLQVMVTADLLIVGTHHSSVSSSSRSHSG